MLKALLKLPKKSKTKLILIYDFLSVLLALGLSFKATEVSRAIDYNQMALLFFGVALFSLLATRVAGVNQALIRFLDEKVVVKIFGVSVVSGLFCFAINGLFFELKLNLAFYLIFMLSHYFLILTGRFYAKNLSVRFHSKKSQATPVAIYGAGRAGLQIQAALAVEGQYQPVFFFDDNPELQGRTINGLKVLLPLNPMKTLADNHCTNVVIAIPTLSKESKQKIINKFELNKVHVRTLPSYSELFSDKVIASDIREIQIEDLLGRESVPPLKDLISKCVLNKNVLISGAGGSIGSELARQVARQSPQCIVLFDLNEFHLYEIDRSLRKQFPDIKIEIILGDIKSLELVSQVLMKYKINTFYHAAAYKHVPIIESNETVGLINNALGTYTALQASIRQNVENFVLISTDKAVRPTNVMGASKRLAELIVQGMKEHAKDTKISIVRFGNVLGSSGSVVPLFKSQINEGGPLTVTHKDVTRYFMTISEAAQLVIQAGALGSEAEVFVLDMGEPIKIYDLAMKMISLSGLSQDQLTDPPIQITGLRPGEKLYEELLIGNNVTKTIHPRILRAQEHKLSSSDLEHLISELHSLKSEHGQEARQIVKKYVLEYQAIQ